MRNFLFLFCVLILCGCSTKKVVNPSAAAPDIILLGLGSIGPVQAGEQVSAKESSPMQTYVMRAPSQGIGGRVYFKGPLPNRAGLIRMALSRIEAQKRVLIVEFNSAQDGSFSVTQPLMEGDYELSVQDPRYTGLMKFSIKKPIGDLIFEIDRK